MTQTMLNTAEPTIVPTPTSPLATKMPTNKIKKIANLLSLDSKNLPITAVNNSGEDDPPAINVAPATSSSSCNA